MSHISLENQLTKLTLEYENKIYYLQNKIRELEDQIPYKLKKIKDSTQYENLEKMKYENRIISLELELKSTKNDLEMYRKKCIKLELELENSTKALNHYNILNDVSQLKGNSTEESSNNTNQTINLDKSRSRIKGSLKEISLLNGDQQIEKDIINEFDLLYRQLIDLKKENEIKDRDIEELVIRLKEELIEQKTKDEAKIEKKLNESKTFDIQSSKSDNKVVADKVDINLEKLKKKAIDQIKENTLDAKSPNLLNESLQLKKELKDKEIIINLLKQDLEKANNKIRTQEKIIESLNSKMKNDVDKKVNVEGSRIFNQNNNSTTIKKLERDIANLSKILDTIKKEKEILLAEINLYEEELTKITEYFKNCINGIQYHDGSSIEKNQLIQIFEDFEQIEKNFINRKAKIKESFKKDDEILHKSYENQEYLTLFSENEQLKQEILEWKQENEYIANKLRGYELVNFIPIKSSNQLYLLDNPRI